MNLTPAEQAWLDEYRQTLAMDYPGLVHDILIFGSKARADAGPDSDLDVLVVLNQADRRSIKRGVRHTGHLLSALSDVMPSIMVYTRAEWQARESSMSPFYRTVMRDAVHVA